MKKHILYMLLTLALGFAASAQSTAFTYQGRLKNGAALAAGLHDFRFTLFNAASGGVAIGAPQCVDNILVTEGLFTTTLDFGPQFVTTGDRFLLIEVRADTGLACANVTGFTTLAPRQPLTAAPIATHAKTAFSLAAADGLPANAVFVDNDGKVGVGTTAPTHTIHIASTAPTLAIQDTDSTTQQVGYVDYRDSANVSQGWVGFGSSGDPDFSIVNARPSGDIVLSTLGGGNVGIGTGSPAAALDVRGDIRLGSTGQLRAVGGEESLRMLRGTINVTGGIVRGSGFAAIQQSAGKYLVTYDTPFTSTPCVTATSFHIGGDARRFMMILSSTASSVLIAAYHPDNGSSLDTQFDFCVIGPR